MHTIVHEDQKTHQCLEAEVLGVSEQPYIVLESRLHALDRLACALKHSVSPLVWGTYIRPHSLKTSHWLSPLAVSLHHATSHAHSPEGQHPGGLGSHTQF